MAVFIFKEMKSKVKKQSELEKAKDLLQKSNSLVFADFSKISAEQLRQLRRLLQEKGAKFLVIKKRLLGIALKEKGIEYNPREHKASLGTVFTPGPVEEASVVVHKFFASLGKKDLVGLVGGYDGERKEVLSQEDIRFLGKLPPREVLLAQVMGIFVAPLRSFLYILQEKSKQEEVQKS